MRNRMPPVIVEYTAKGRRVRRYFDDAYAARRFYRTKFKSGASPRVRRVEHVKKKQRACVACGGTGKSSKGAPCVPCKGTGIPFEGYWPEKNRPRTTTLGFLKVGDRFGLADGTGRTGRCEYVSESSVRVVLEDGGHYNWAPSVSCVKLEAGQPCPSFPLPSWLGDTVPSTTSTKSQEPEEPAGSKSMSTDTPTAVETKKSTKKGVKKAATKKAASKKATKTAKASKKGAKKGAKKGTKKAARAAHVAGANGVFKPKEAAALLMLDKLGATTQQKAIPRKDVWDKHGMAACGNLRNAGFIEWSELDEDRVKRYYLTAEGKKAVRTLKKAK